MNDKVADWRGARERKPQAWEHPLFRLGGPEFSKGEQAEIRLANLLVAAAVRDRIALWS